MMRAYALQHQMMHELNDQFITVHLTSDALKISTMLSRLYENIKFLRRHKNLLYTQLMDVCVIDWLGRAVPRFELVYMLLSMTHRTRVRVHVEVDENALIPSISSIFSNAAWYEREVFDMMGLKFSDLSDHRRLLTDYDFEGHPLRKDFPLSGHEEVIYDGKTQSIQKRPVELPQQYRDFRTYSPWKGPSAGNYEQREAVSNNALQRAQQNIIIADDVK